MKKVTLAVGAIVALLSASCSGGDNASPKVVRATGDSAAYVCNFRYVDLDSVWSSYTLAQELVASQQKEMLSVESAARQKHADLQQRGANIQNKAQSNGYLSEASMQSDIQDLQKRENEANTWLSNQQNRLARLQAENEMRLRDSIQKVLNHYLEVHGLDAIFIDKQAGFFRSDLDITGEVIEALNASYTPEKAE